MLDVCVWLAPSTRAPIWAIVHITDRTLISSRACYVWGTNPEMCTSQFVRFGSGKGNVGSRPENLAAPCLVMIVGEIQNVAGTTNRYRFAKTCINPIIINVVTITNTTSTFHFGRRARDCKAHTTYSQHRTYIEYICMYILTTTKRVWLFSHRCVRSLSLSLSRKTCKRLQDRHSDAIIRCWMLSSSSSSVLVVVVVSGLTFYASGHHYARFTCESRNIVH